MSVLVPITPQCKSDQECPLSERCVNQGCVEACRIDPCGINAQCISQNHQAACSCPPGYTGNPHTECSLRKCSITMFFINTHGHSFKF